MPKALYKTTIVIWTEYDPRDSHMSLEDLGREAEQGEAYCSRERTTRIRDPRNDPDYEDNEFFDLEEEDGCV